MKAVPPMLAVPASALPVGADWTYEVKWDGYRAQALKRGDAVSLASRNLKNITRQYPGVERAATTVRARTAHIDGEIVALDAQGRPSFQALHHWSLDGLTIVYYAFDLLHLDGEDLVDVPLEERRAALREIVAGSHVRLSEPLPGSPARIETAVRELGLEGVVAKRRLSTYAPGRRNGAWVKVRFSRRQEFVIGGFKPNAGGLETLVVGYYEGRRLMCAGRVRAGLTPRLRADLFARVAPLIASQCPFVNLPTQGSGHWGEGITAEDMKALQWVRPRLVVEVSFVEWTRDGSLRHAAFVALRDDKRVRDVVRDRTGQTER